VRHCELCDAISGMSIKTSKMSERGKNILYLVTVFLIEVFYFSFIFFGYAIFSMLFFGAGGNSFMYSKANGIIFLSLLIVPPSLLNIYFYRKLKKSKRQVNFLIVQVAMFLLFFFAWHMSGWDFYF
jgi:TRAP-type C4-dicarboxylate transport system permease small subunit